MLRAWLGRSTKWLLGLALPLGLLAVAWSRVDLAAGAARLAALGPLALIAFLPAALMLALDALGWRLLFAPTTRGGIPFGSAWAARWAGEAVGQSLPSAGLAGEAASAWYLSRRTAVPLAQAIGCLAARRVLVAAGHALLLVLAAVLGAASRGIPRPLVALVGAAGLALLLAAIAGTRLLVQGAPFLGARELLRRAPWAGLRVWAGAGAARLRTAHREASRPFTGSPLPRLAAGLAFLLMFLTESLETLLLLRLVGAPLSLVQVLAIEPLVSLLRAIAFFVPAGIGVQELGYVALLHRLGVPQAAAAGAAFVLLKRTKEVAWTAGGWSVLLRAGARVEPRAEVRDEPQAAADPVHLRIAQPDDADAPDRARVA